jgi:hypothetical protein
MKALAYVGLFMGSLFVTIGILLPLYFPPLMEQWGNTGNYVVGVVVVLYGILRLNRAYKVLKNAR